MKRSCARTRLARTGIRARFSRSPAGRGPAVGGVGDSPRSLDGIYHRGRPDHCRSAARGPLVDACPSVPVHIMAPTTSVITDDSAVETIDVGPPDLAPLGSRLRNLAQSLAIRNFSTGAHLICCSRGEHGLDVRRESSGAAHDPHRSLGSRSRNVVLFRFGRLYFGPRGAVTMLLQKACEDEVSASCNASFFLPGAV